MNQSSYVTILPLPRSTRVLEWLKMVGTRSIVFYVIMGVTSSAFQSISLLNLLFII